MPQWLTHISNSLADQAATWFVGVVLALFGVFSGRLVESVKFAVNRADLRTKYYEEMAEGISHFVFIIDRIIRVSLESSWASDEANNEISSEYNEVMNQISRKEYVYFSWMQHFWGKRMADAFFLTMERIRTVDGILIELNEDETRGGGQKEVLVEKLKRAQGDLQHAAHTLLVTTI